MIDMYENILTRFKSIFKKNPPKSKALSTDAEGMFFVLWGWALPLLISLTVGWLGMACFEVWLEGLNGRYRPIVMASGPASSGQEDDVENLSAFLRVNPFRVSPMPGQSSPEPVAEEAPPPAVGSMAGAILKGTSPGFMAWMEHEGNLKLVRLGESFDGYTLEEVTYLAATFVKENECVVKEIAYSGGSATLVSSRSPPPPPVAVQAYVPQAVSNQPIYPVAVIPSYTEVDMSNYALGNPFEEIRKIRIVPGGAAQGLKVDWLSDDSILARLGVEPGDVLREINSNSINNLMDITNSLDMEHTYNFTVEVMRNGEPTTLEYYVR